MHIEAKKAGLFGKEKLMWTLSDDAITVHQNTLVNKIGNYPIDGIVLVKIDVNGYLGADGFNDADNIDENIAWLSNIIFMYGDGWASNPQLRKEFFELNGFFLSLTWISQKDRDEAYQYISEHSRVSQLKESVDILKGIHNKPHEIRKKCNVCGTVFCYTDQDLKDNVGRAVSNLAGSVSQIGGVATGNIGAAIYGKQNTTNQVIDYNRCPNCNSTDISPYHPSEEAESVPASNQQQHSDADEILKFKNLLDMGVITQEEFDAKKQQLLGL